MEKISKEMTIGDIFDNFSDFYDNFVKEFEDIGLYCFGCPSKAFESLENGMLNHGFSSHDIDNLVLKLNDIINEERS